MSNKVSKRLLIVRKLESMKKNKTIKKFLVNKKLHQFKIQYDANWHLEFWENFPELISGIKLHYKGERIRSWALDLYNKETKKNRWKRFSESDEIRIKYKGEEDYFFSILDVIYYTGDIKYPATKAQHLINAQEMYDKYNKSPINVIKDILMRLAKGEAVHYIEKAMYKMCYYKVAEKAKTLLETELTPDEFGNISNKELDIHSSSEVDEYLEDLENVKLDDEYFEEEGEEEGDRDYYDGTGLEAHKDYMRDIGLTEDEPICRRERIIRTDEGPGVGLPGNDIIEQESTNLIDPDNYEAIAKLKYPNAPRMSEWFSQKYLSKGYMTQEERLLRWFFYDQTSFKARIALIERNERRITRERKRYRKFIKTRIVTRKLLKGSVNIDVVYSNGKVYPGRMFISKGKAIIEPITTDIATSIRIVDSHYVEDLEVIDFGKIPYERKYHTDGTLEKLRKLAYE